MSDAAAAASSDARPKTLYQGVERDGFGMRLLSKMGWVEGRGLGKRGDGIATHVRARKRMDFVGVGADARCDASGKTTVDWTMNTLAFDDVLRSLNRAHSAESLGRVWGEASSSSSSEEEKEEKKRKPSKEERREAKRAKKEAKKEAKRKKKNEIVVNRSVVSHAGRYQKRVSQKMVSNYSSEDLGAILGGGFVSLPEVRAGAVASPSASASEGEDDSNDTKKQIDAQPKKLIAFERPKWVFEPPPESWWGWRVGFRPEGHGKKPEDEDVDALERKRGFDEDDQVNLFKDTHAGANKNRQGLGAGRGRDAGADFAGTKKTFGEQDEVSEAERAAAKKAKEVKWQKIAEKILAKCEGSMKTKKFKDKVLAKCGCAKDEHDIYWDAAFHILSRTGVFTSLEEDIVKFVSER